MYWEKELSKEIGGVGHPRVTLDFSYLTGAIIEDVGFHPESPEGGFTIDYEKNGEKRRVVFGFNELGLWKEWNGVRGNPSAEDLLKQKLRKIIDSDEWALIDIVDDPKNRRYRFMSEGKEILVLDIKEIKLLPENLRNCFSINEKEKRDEAILMQLPMYALD